MTKNGLEAKSNKIGLEKVNILGVKVAITEIKRVIAMIRDEIGKKPGGRPFFVVTVNPEFVMEAQRDVEFRHILNSADLAIPDGWGIVWASRGRVPESVPGRRVVEKLVGGRKYRVFYLGGRGGVAREMAERYGGEWDEGAGDVKFEILNLKRAKARALRASSNVRILNKINKYRPDLLLVAYGAPWQEKWLFANRSLLKAKVVMGVGGTFDYLTGKAKIPPIWMQKMHLEWLWRLVREPWRWRRQANLARFGGKVLIFRSKKSTISGGYGRVG